MDAYAQRKGIVYLDVEYVRFEQLVGEDALHRLLCEVQTIVENSEDQENHIVLSKVRIAQPFVGLRGHIRSGRFATQEACQRSYSLEGRGDVLCLQFVQYNVVFALLNERTVDENVSLDATKFILRFHSSSFVDGRLVLPKHKLSLQLEEFGHDYPTTVVLVLKKSETLFKKVGLSKTFGTPFFPLREVQVP